MSDRKARLAALAAKAGRGNDGGDDQVAAEEESKPTLTFRNYIPKDATLDESADDDAAKQQSSKRQKTSSTAQTKESDQSKSALEIALAKTSRESREAAGQNVGAGGWSKVTAISTKKVNWDLKRDIQHKMDKLERRTQRAIVDLLRERLEKEAAEGGGDDDDSDLD